MPRGSTPASPSRLRCPGVAPTGAGQLAALALQNHRYYRAKIELKGARRRKSAKADPSAQAASAAERADHPWDYLRCRFKPRKQALAQLLKYYRSRPIPAMVILGPGAAATVASDSCAANSWFKSGTPNPPFGQWPTRQ